MNLAIRLAVKRADRYRYRWTKLCTIVAMSSRSNLVSSGFSRFWILVYVRGRKMLEETLRMYDSHGGVGGYFPKDPWKSHGERRTNLRRHFRCESDTVMNSTLKIMRSEKRHTFKPTAKRPRSFVQS